jgi:hypothetical protein
MKSEHYSGRLLDIICKDLRSTLEKPGSDSWLTCESGRQDLYKKAVSLWVESVSKDPRDFPWTIGVVCSVYQRIRKASRVGVEA